MSALFAQFVQPFRFDWLQQMDVLMGRLAAFCWLAFSAVLWAWSGRSAARQLECAPTC